MQMAQNSPKDDGNLAKAKRMGKRICNLNTFLAWLQKEQKKVFQTLQSNN
jgi:hypothetical protein